MTYLNLKLALVLVLLSSVLFAQKFYVSLNGGYGFPIQTQTGILSNLQFEFEEQTGQINNKLYKSESVDLSLGKGFNFGGSIGYMFNENMGVDLGISYLKGAKTFGGVEGYDRQIQSNGDVYLTQTNDTNFMYSKMIRLSPSFVLTTSRFEKFNPYTRLGIVFGFGSIYSERNTQELYYTGVTLQHSRTSTLKETFDGGVAFGINAAAGFGYDFSEKFKITCEVNYMGMSYSPEKSYLTELKSDDNDVLDQVTVKDKETEYLDSFTYTSFSSPSDEPKQEEKITRPLNSIGINFGIKYSF
jgi:hypothetical protein